jgi:two-component system invasion response regulator UvrY
MIRVFVADDHDIVRSGLQRLLAEDPEIQICGEASTGSGLVDRARRERPDVVVLDINMPGNDGTKTVRALTQLTPPPAVVIFTMYPEDSHAVAYLRSGAKAFLNKRRSIRELADAIRTVSKGRRYVTPELARYLFEHSIDVEKAASKIFSPRERQVILRLAEGGRAVDIAAETGVSASTVNTYVQRIKEKLGVRSIVEIVEFARDNALLG